jgi:hypothetical protein
MPERDGIEYRVVTKSVVPVVLMTGKDCITIRRTIYTRKSTMHRRTHAHEYAHVRQWRDYGVLRFLWRYLRDLVRFGYAKHPLEIAAHQFAHDHEAEFEHIGRAQ